MGNVQHLCKGLTLARASGGAEPVVRPVKPAWRYSRLQLLASVLIVAAAMTVLIIGAQAIHAAVPRFSLPEAQSRYEEQSRYLALVFPVLALGVPAAATLVVRRFRLWPLASLIPGSLTTLALHLLGLWRSASAPF